MSGVEKRSGEERREGYCAMHDINTEKINRHGGMWTLLLLFIMSMLGFAGYIGATTQKLDKNVSTFIATTEQSMRMYEGVFLDVKAMLSLQGDMIRDIDGRVRHLEYRIDSRLQPLSNNQDN